MEECRVIYDIAEGEKQAARGVNGQAKVQPERRSSAGEGDGGVEGLFSSKENSDLSRSKYFCNPEEEV